jgi:hypothetical protein
MFDYSCVLQSFQQLPAPFHAVAGPRYWVKIAAFQPGVPGWGLASGSGGDGQHFESFVNYAGGTQYRFNSGDAAFALLTPSGPTTTITTTTAPTTTSSSSTSSTTTTSSPSTTTSQPTPTTTSTLLCTSARCTLDVGLRSPECAGEAIPRAITKKLDKAMHLIEEARGTSRKAKALLKQAKRILGQAAVATGKAPKGKGPKLSSGCAAAIQRAVNDLRAGLGV